MKRCFTLHYYAGWSKTGKEVLELDCSKNSKVFHFCDHGDERIVVIDLDNKQVHVASVYEGEIKSNSYSLKQRNVRLLDFETLWVKGKGEADLVDPDISKRIRKILDKLFVYGISYRTVVSHDEFVGEYDSYILYLNCKIVEKIKSINDEYLPKINKLERKLFNLNRSSRRCKNN